MRCLDVAALADAQICEEEGNDSYLQKSLILVMIAHVAVLGYWLFMALVGGLWLDQAMAQHVTASKWLRLVPFSIICLSGALLIGFSFYIWSGFVLPRQYGLLHQDFKSWLRQSTKYWVGFALVHLLVIWAAYGLAWLLGTWWLLLAVLAYLPARWLTGMFVPPRPDDPRAHKIVFLEDGATLERLKELFRRAGMPHCHVFEVKLSETTVAVNAWMAGSQVWLGDNLIANLTLEELESVCAHELGHYKLKHIWQLEFATGVVLLTSIAAAYLLVALPFATMLGHAAPDAVSALPLIMFAFAAWRRLLTPAMLWVSRRCEQQADWYALELTGNPEAFRSSHRKMALVNNVPLPGPTWWLLWLFSTHPSTAERLRMADKWEAQARRIGHASCC